MSHFAARNEELRSVPIADHPDNLDPIAKLILADTRHGYAIYQVRSGFVVVDERRMEALMKVQPSLEDALAAVKSRVAFLGPSQA